MILIAWLLATASAWASTPVGTAVLVHGQVGKFFGAHNVTLREGDKVEEGAQITTGPSGSAKILMLDKTELKIAPSSSIQVQSLKSREPGVVTLVNGNLRAKVDADPLAKPARRAVRFMFRTKTATMGVRGTELDMVYNSKSELTSVVTLEGEVWMAKNPPAAPDVPTPSMGQMVAQFENSRTVITEGNFSTAARNLPEPTIPTKISPAQFETLKAADPTSSRPGGAAPGAAGGGAFFSPIPPGVDPKTFMGAAETVERQLKDAIGTLPPGAATGTRGEPPPAQGYYDPKSGAYAPPAGGYLDLKTGVYVPPPPGSAYDANTGVVIPPPAMGAFDPNTGHFTPPPGMILTSEGRFTTAPVALPFGTSGNGPVPPPMRGSETTAAGGMMPPGGMWVPGMMPPDAFPPGMMPPGGYYPPGSMPPGYYPPGSMPPEGEYYPPPSVPVVGGDGSCGAGCVPQAPPPGYSLPPPPPPTNGTTVQFNIIVK